MFEFLPREVTIIILEIVCSELVDELANIGEKEAPYFGDKLRSENTYKFGCELSLLYDVSCV